jgi:hypothetical protein
VNEALPLLHGLRYEAALHEGAMKQNRLAVGVIKYRAPAGTSEDRLLTLVTGRTNKGKRVRINWRRKMIPRA